MSQIMTFSTFMNKRGRCAIIRVYAPDPADVPFRVDHVRRTVAAFDRYSFCRRPSVTAILVLVFANPRYGDRADCGRTTAAIREALGQVGPTYSTPNLKITVIVEEMKHGEPCSSMLNEGIQMSGRLGCDYSMILAPDAHQYITEANLGALYEACCNGARAAGLVIHEYQDILLQSGGVSNACALWDNRSLAIVHGFDRFSAMPLDKNRVEMGPDGAMVVEGGAEEWTPLRWFVDEFGQCVAPVTPVDNDACYQTPDPVTQKALWLRRQVVQRTKLARRDAALARVQADPDTLIRGIMPQYRSNLLR